MDRAHWRVVVALLAGTSLGGCATPEDGPGGQAPVVEPAALYTHRWVYGPAYSGTDGMPVFEDNFEVAAGVTNLTVRITWRIDAGHAAVVFGPPGSDPVNITDDRAGGPRGSHEATLSPEPGTWRFRIETWAASDGAFPAGRVDAVVAGA